MRCTEGAPEFEAKPKTAKLEGGKEVQVNGLKVKKGKPPPPKTAGRPKLCAAAPMQQQEYVQAKQGIPSRVDLRKWMSPVEHQEQTNSCCANAVAGWLL
jgi:hypothetical protein